MRVRLLRNYDLLTVNYKMNNSFKILLYKSKDFFEKSIKSKNKIKYKWPTKYINSLNRKWDFLLEKRTFYNTF